MESEGSATPAPAVTSKASAFRSVCAAARTALETAGAIPDMVARGAR